MAFLPLDSYGSTFLLFYIFNGVRRSKEYPPVKECPSEVECKLNWALQWRDKNRLWADPSKVPEDKKWRIYGKQYLDGSRLKNASLFDLPKLLIGCRVNRASVNPLVIQLDNTGFCPDKDVFCLLPVNQVNKHTHKYKPTNIVPDKWENLTYEKQRLWLLGILASKLGNALSLSGRSVRGISVAILCNLPLPARIDPRIDRRIIETARQIVERDQNHEPIPEPDELRIQLDRLVKESYGNPQWMEISRTGTPTGLEEWKKERTKPTLTVIGQVLEISENNEQILLYLAGLIDDNEEAWLPMLPELPGWALDGTVFKAELSEDVETFQDLAENPWSLRHFRHTPYPYLTNEELKQKLRIETIESRL